MACSLQLTQQLEIIHPLVLLGGEPGGSVVLSIAIPQPVLIAMAPVVIQNLAVQGHAARPWELLQLEGFPFMCALDIRSVCSLRSCRISSSGSAVLIQAGQGPTRWLGTQMGCMHDACSLLLFLLGRRRRFDCWLLAAPQRLRRSLCHRQQQRLRVPGQDAHRRGAPLLGQGENDPWGAAHRTTAFLAMAPGASSGNLHASRCRGADFSRVPGLR